MNSSSTANPLRGNQRAAGSEGFQGQGELQNSNSSQQPATLPPTCWRAVIPECPPSANVLIRTHFRERKVEKEKFYALLYGAFFHEEITRAKGKRKVKLWLRSKRSRDYANLFLGADKYILDNLKRLGYIVDDNPKWLDLQVVGEVGIPQTVIEISEVTA